MVNSISPTVLETTGLVGSQEDLINEDYGKLTKKQFEKISFKLDDEKYEEARNIHYVGVSRSKHNLYFMIYGF